MGGLAGELSRLVASPATWLELVLEYRRMEVFFSGYTAVTLPVLRLVLRSPHLLLNVGRGGMM